MYARQLSEILHRSLTASDSFDSTLKRFETLRGYGLLPRGRENAAVRLSDTQIASAALGFVPTLAGWAGHVSLIMGRLLPVGGSKASFKGTGSLLDSITAVIASDQACTSLVSFTFSIAHKQNGEAYFAGAIFAENGERKTTSYVSHTALTLLREGAEKGYDREKVNAPHCRQLVLGGEFFSRLRRDVQISRSLQLPLKTNWQEYGSEEERTAFHKSLGALPNSKFLNLSVDTQATWPKEPTRVQFAGHHFVMFPRTKEYSNSISIDLANERLHDGEARTLLNRFLSLLSWCEDQYAVLEDGWAGNPVPLPVPRSESGSSTTSHWVFTRGIPANDELLQRLAYYREGLNARRAGLVTFEVLSFFKVFEIRAVTKKGERNPTKLWIEKAFQNISSSISSEVIQRFDRDRRGKSVENYIFENCRVATAHTSAEFPSDADSSPEIQRLYSAADIVHALARHFIATEYRFSDLYYSDEISSGDE